MNLSGAKVRQGSCDPPESPARADPVPQLGLIFQQLLVSRARLRITCGTCANVHLAFLLQGVFAALTLIRG